MAQGNDGFGYGAGPSQRTTMGQKIQPRQNSVPGPTDGPPTIGTGSTYGAPVVVPGGANTPPRSKGGKLKQRGAKKKPGPIGG